MGEHYKRGQALYENARYDEALRQFQDELAEFPNSPDANYMVACALLATNKPEAALRYAQEAVRLAPNSSFAYHVLGRVMLQHHGQLTKKVLDIFNVSISLDPDDIQNYSYLAGVYLFNSRWAKARPIIERGLALQPHNARLLAYSGWCNFHYDQTPLAIEQLRESLRIDPLNALAHRYLASIFTIRGDIEQAKEHITESHRIDPRPIELAPGFGQYTYTSHDLMSQIVMAHGTLYGKVLSMFGRMDHWSKTLEAKHGSNMFSLGAVLAIACLATLIGASPSKVSDLIAMVFGVGMLIATAAFVLTWLIALSKMVADKQKRNLLSGSQRRAIVITPITLGLVSLITVAGVTYSESQQKKLCEAFKSARLLQSKGDLLQASNMLKFGVQECISGLSLGSYRIALAAHDAGVHIEVPEPNKSSASSVTLANVVIAAYDELIDIAWKRKDLRLKRALEVDLQWCLDRINR